MQRSPELSKLCLDAGYILAQNSENVVGKSVFKAILWLFLFSKQISVIYSAIPQDTKALCVLYEIILIHSDSPLPARLF